MGVACRRRPRGRRGRLHGGHRRSDRARGCNRAAHRCGRERQHPLCPDLDHSPRLIRAEAEGARAVSRSAPRPSIHHDPPDTPIDLLRRGADGPPRRLFPRFRPTRRLLYRTYVPVFSEESARLVLARRRAARRHATGRGASRIAFLGHASASPAAESTAETARRQCSRGAGALPVSGPGDACPGSERE